MYIFPICFTSAGQACTEKLKDKNKSSEPRTEDCWSQRQTLPWATVSSVMCWCVVLWTVFILFALLFVLQAPFEFCIYFIHFLSTWWFPCLCRFTLKHKNGNNGESEEITVFDYFVKNRGIELQYSGDLPCINVGKPKRPTYLPVEVTIIKILMLFLCCKALSPC
jgi:hypothetical protein